LLAQNNAPQFEPLSQEALGNLWGSWVEKEKFFPGFAREQQPPRNIEKDSGTAERLENLEQEPRYTWKLPGTAGNGKLVPINGRPTNQVGDAGRSDY
jgi:hypothetical protein